MSGTSVDGIDAALVRVTGGPTRASAPLGGRYGARVVAHVERRWPAAVRGRLLAVMAPAMVRTEEICALNFLVAREFAAAVGEVLREAGVAAGRVAAVASHGQTICHLPPSGKKQEARSKKQEMGLVVCSTRNCECAPVRSSLPYGRGSEITRNFERNLPPGSTLQIGDISVLAALTGIRVVGNFRAADVAVGGQGAPLVPWADAMLFSDAKVARCVQNIGGIGNVTYLPAVGQRKGRMRGQGDKETRRQGEGVIAFDTGPGNMLMDAVVRMVTKGREQFDQDGRMAASGSLCTRLLGRLQAHSYFARRPPKSTGREMFGEAYARRLVESYENRKVWREDLVHTLTRLTAWSIGDAYRRFLPRMPEEVILCGGGADNPVLVGMLGEELRAGAMLSGHSSRGLRKDGRDAPPSMAHMRLRRIDELGIPNKAKEAACFALLAAAALDGVPGNLPGVTGARRAVILGEIADPHIGRRH